MTEQLLRLLTWLSPAFPTGGFAYSHGLEWAVEAGDVRDAAALTSWLDDLLRHGAPRNDAILLRQAYRAGAGRLAEIAEFAAACAPAREIAAETLNQGGAFIAAASPWMPDPLAAILPAPIAHPVAVGALAAACGIGEDAAVTAYLHGFIANLVSAGVRLIPLGQTAGLRVQKALEAAILETAAATRYTQLEDIGGACLRADLAAMRHETQYTRLFRS
jgi:urease accessory protein